MKRISLNGTWKLCGRRDGHPEDELIRLDATVPGCVQLDLSEAGLLPKDLLVGMNITETEKYEGHEWWYERTFIAPEERKNVFLVFRGVDCLAEYFLNGEKIGESDNMFIPFEFDVSNKLRDGENTLTVHISSAVKYAHEQDYDLYNIAVSGRNTPINTAIRRAPHSYGWDIMPRAVTSGLWRDVTLEVRDDIYFTQRFFDFSEAHSQFCYVLDSDWDDFHNVEIEIDASCGDSVIKERFAAPYKAGRIRLNVRNKKLWWPYGYGDASIYDATLRIYRDGELVHEEDTHFGIRTVKLEYTDYTDGKNGYFRIKINGEEIMCKGSNWVPLDPFHSRDAGRYETALNMAKDLGCNILRCWGGNVYEDHAFFEFCDRNGIMVWQDFAMACNNYPQREEFFEKLRKEATSVVQEYRHHPSIVLWCGDNEIDRYAYRENSRPSLNKISREVLPRIIEVHDIGRPYIASSPYISDKVFEDRTFEPAEEHLWGGRYHKSDFYKNAKSHFISEMGYFALPSIDSIKTFITTKELWPYKNNPQWALHSTDQKNNDGRIYVTEYQMRQMFGSSPEDFEDLILASQIAQAEAYKFFIERMRIGRPLRSGIIWWNMLDGWPQTSDAIVDYYFRKKCAYDYVKRSQEPFIVAIDEITEGAAYNIYACNDTLKEVKGHVTISDADSGYVFYETDFYAKPNTATRIGAPLRVCDFVTKKMFIIKWTGDFEGLNHYLTGYPPYSFEEYKALMEKNNL